jgi:hypothetical protein
MKKYAVEIFLLSIALLLVLMLIIVPSTGGGGADPDADHPTEEGSGEEWSHGEDHGHDTEPYTGE